MCGFTRHIVWVRGSDERRPYGPTTPMSQHVAPSSYALIFVPPAACFWLCVETATEVWRGELVVPRALRLLAYAGDRHDEMVGLRTGHTLLFKSSNHVCLCVLLSLSLSVCNRSVSCKTEVIRRGRKMLDLLCTDARNP